MMISVLSIFSFRKLELSHVFISCTQNEILLIWGGKEGLHDVCRVLNIISIKMIAKAMTL